MSQDGAAVGLTVVFSTYQSLPVVAEAQRLVEDFDLATDRRAAASFANPNRAVGSTVMEARPPRVIGANSWRWPRSTDRGGSIGAVGTPGSGALHRQVSRWPQCSQDTRR